MYKKTFIILSVFSVILFIGTTSLAAMNANDVKNGVNGVTNTIVDGVNNLGSDVRTGIGNAENTIEGAVNDVNNMNNNENQNNEPITQNDQNDNYTATRTADDASFLGTSTNTWLWIAIIVAAAIIIGIVWYYATQTNDR